MGYLAQLGFQMAQLSSQMTHMGIFLGSNPNRGQSPLQWREIPQTPPNSPQTPQTGPRTPCMEGEWVDGCTDGISHPLRLHNIKEAGQGNC